MEERAAEATEVEQALGGAIEGHPHAVEQVDDTGGGVSHAFDGGLVGEEVATERGFLEMNARAVAFAHGVDGGIDPALCAHGVAALDGHEGEHVHGDAGFAQPDGGHQASESATDHDHATHLSGFAADFLLVYHRLRAPG